MLVIKGRRQAIRTLQGWAVSVLLEADAICECEAHGWLQDRADPQARARALVIAREQPPGGVSVEAAVAAMMEVLEGIGDACPECAAEGA
ncbi:hypothetical protein [Bradyrhizobium sp. ARR65]|uniref:hypothetical protein n=1 Tax=Bradyrhizobium sp. ARR65 TaxID=1040989 RepID=UPI0004636B2D|nr:hypothetical protein [Bradyrhizobium sp. ARR65]